MPLQLHPLEEVVNVHWGGEIIQITADGFEDVMLVKVYPTSDFGFNTNYDDPLAQALECNAGKTFKSSDLKESWLTNFINASLDYANGFTFSERLIQINKRDPYDIDHFNPEVVMDSSGLQPFDGGKGEARLRIYPKSTIWTFVDGNPPALVANQSPSYDKTKVTPSYSEARRWQFNKNGWLDDEDLGTYSPTTEVPERPPDGGGPSISMLINVSSSNLVVGEWSGCVREIDGITGVDIRPPASHVDGSGIITTGEPALVEVSVQYVPDTEGGAVADCECAILEAGTFAVLATGDRQCSVVFSGQVMAGARKKSSGPETLARATITVTSPPPP